MNMIPFLLKIHYIYLYIHIHAYDGNMWGEAINFLFLRSIGIGFRGYFTLCHIFLSFLKVFTNIYISIMLLWISEKQNVTPEVGLAREYQPSSHEFLRGTPEPFWSAGCQSALVSRGGTGAATHGFPWNLPSATTRVSWPTLHQRAYIWPLPIAHGFSRLLHKRQK